MPGKQRESDVGCGDQGSVQQHGSIITEASGDRDIGCAIEVEVADRSATVTVAGRDPTCTAVFALLNQAERRKQSKSFSRRGTSIKRDYWPSVFWMNRENTA